MSEDKPKPITVSGNRLSITRLDPEGNPVGEPIEVTSTNGLSIDVDPNDPDTMVVMFEVEPFKPFTMDVTLTQPDPEMIALLTGQSTTEVELWMGKSVPWWKRLVRKVKVGWLR